MKTVHELTANELEELRSRYYHERLDNGSLKEISNEEEIPMAMLKRYYEDTFFVEDDFFCNL